MKKKNSLQDKASRMVIILTEGSLIIISVILFILIFRLRGTFIQSGNEAGKEAEKISSAAMTDQMKSSLLQLAEGKADLADKALEEFQVSVQTVADTVSHIYNNMEEYDSRSVPLPDASKDGELSLQLLFSEKTDTSGADVRNELGKIANAQDTLLAVNKNDPNMVSNYIATKTGIMIQADYISAKKFDENGNIMPYEASERPWYRGALQSEAPYFTSLSRDAHTSGIGIMCGVPFYQGKEIMGVAGAGMYLDELQKAVLDTKIGKNGYACMIDGEGKVIFSSGSGETFSADPDTVADLRQSEKKELAELVTAAVEGKEGVSLFDIDGASSYIAYAPLKTVGWTFLTVIPEQEVNEPTQSLMTSLQGSTDRMVESSNHQIRNMVFAVIVIILILSAFSFLSSKKASEILVRQMKELTLRVQKIKGDDLNFEWEEDTGDEIQILADAFSSMTVRMKQYIHDITTITAEKERIGAELDLATKIQADMLPNIFPAFPEREDFDIHASMTPAKEVGGDFYDFFLVDDDHLAIVMADVSGKGVPAALFMMMSKILINDVTMMAGPDASPAEVLTKVNDTICQNNKEEMFVTVWLGILTISTGHVVAANAGHEYPILKKADGKFELFKDKHGFVIGGMAGMRYKEYEFTIEKGGVLFLYTDGVAEATDAKEELFGIERTLEALNGKEGQDPVSPEKLLLQVKKAVDGFVGDAPQFDDLTMLAVKRTL